MDKIVTAIHEQLALSYAQAGRVIPTNVAIIAASLQDALQFSTVEEVHNAFRRARDMADIPTQRVLKEALTNHRQENLPQPSSYAIEDKGPGRKLVTNEETTYIMATQCVCGMFPYMTEESARKYILEFEADPKNKEMVEYQRGWLKMEIAKRKMKQMSQGR